jgi:hypothetical protein
MKPGCPFGTAVTVDQNRRRHILEHKILFNIVIGKVQKVTYRWMGKYPQMDKGVSKFYYDSFILRVLDGTVTI